MNQSEFSWKNEAGLNLIGREWLPDAEPQAVVALIHGLGEHCGRYQHVAEAFTQAGYAVIAFDLQGHGKSDGVRGHFLSYDSVMQDITHLLNEAKSRHPGVPLFLYGHSLGGNLVLFYTLKQKPQLAGVICTSPGLGVGKVPAVKLFLGKVLYAVAPATQMENGLDVNGLSRDPEVAKKYLADPLVHSKISARLALDLINSGQWIVENAAQFPSVPLLLLQGSADRLVNPAMTELFSKNAPAKLMTYKVFDGHLHELHNEHDKADTIALMSRWIANYIPARA
jgi:acylglycerol lipase